MDTLKGLLIMVTSIIVGTIVVVVGVISVQDFLSGDQPATNVAKAHTKKEPKLLFSTPNKQSWSQQDISKIQTAIGRFSNQCSPLVKYKSDIQSIVLDLRETTHSSLLDRGWQQDAYVQVQIKESLEGIPKSYRAWGQTCHYNLGLGAHTGISVAKSPCQKLCAMTPEQMAQDYIAEPKQIDFEQAPQQQHEKQVRAQFSSWDGSHRNLEQRVKANLHDPSSYKHDETVFWDQEDHIIVSMSYQAKNAYGALVKGHVKAKVNMDGNILEIMDAW
ncbi:MAG: hypothetical protein K6L74_06610 [Neptuniibacter sp.]